MVINFSLPEFATVIHDELRWIEDYAKDFELSRRKVLASAARTEKNKKEIENLSEAFTYILSVDFSGAVEIERIPGHEKNQIANDVIEETYQILHSVISDEIRYSLSNSSEFKKLISDQLKPQIQQLLEVALNDGVD